MAHVLIVSADFYEDIANDLLIGAKRVLDEAGVSSEVVTVPGALEIPTAIGYGANAKRFSGFVALGCVIRGLTYHFELVCNESARGLTLLGSEHQLAIGNGILTCENMKQAKSRANPEDGDKGGDAAHAALTLMKLRYHFESGNR